MTKVIYYRVVSTGWLQPDLLDTDLINSFNKNIFYVKLKKSLFSKSNKWKKIFYAGKSVSGALICINYTKSPLIRTTAK